jgi:putative ABC transport system substrate-binding protein
VAKLDGVTAAGCDLHIVRRRIRSACDRCPAREAQAVIVIPDALTVQQRKRIVGLANQHRLPAVYGLLDFADAGGLLAFGVDQVVLFRRAADYVDKILRGARPGDLPIEQATKYSLVVNLRAAGALGIKMPQGLLLRADEVIR